MNIFDVYKVTAKDGVAHYALEPSGNAPPELPGGSTAVQMTFGTALSNLTDVIAELHRADRNTK